MHIQERATGPVSEVLGAEPDGNFLILGELGHLAWADLTPKGYREISRARLFDAGQT